MERIDWAIRKWGMTDYTVVLSGVLADHKLIMSQQVHNVVKKIIA